MFSKIYNREKELNETLKQLGLSHKDFKLSVSSKRRYGDIHNPTWYYWVTATHRGEVIECNFDPYQSGMTAEELKACKTMMLNEAKENFLKGIK